MSEQEDASKVGVLDWALQVVAANGYVTYREPAAKALEQNRSQVAAVRALADDLDAGKSVGILRRETAARIRAVVDGPAEAPDPTMKQRTDGCSCSGTENPPRPAAMDPSCTDHGIVAEGPVSAGPAEAAEPAPDLIVCTCTTYMKVTGRRCEGCIEDDHQRMFRDEDRRWADLVAEKAAAASVSTTPADDTHVPHLVDAAAPAMRRLLARVADGEWTADEALDVLLDWPSRTASAVPAAPTGKRAELHRLREKHRDFIDAQLAANTESDDIDDLLPGVTTTPDPAAELVAAAAELRKYWRDWSAERRERVRSASRFVHAACERVVAASAALAGSGREDREDPS